MRCTQLKKSMAVVEMAAVAAAIAVNEQSELYVHTNAHIHVYAIMYRQTRKHIYIVAMVTRQPTATAFGLSRKESNNATWKHGNKTGHATSTSSKHNKPSIFVYAHDIQHP